MIKRNWVRLALAGVATAGIAAGTPLWHPAPANAQAVAVQAETGGPWPATAAAASAYVTSGKIPGAVVAIGRKGESPDYLTYGAIAADAGAPRADENSLWRVYSMTKPVTGIAAMILVQEGKLKLDQPISDFIPAFKNMKVLVDPAKDLTSRPAKREITVRHLLTHTAGLGYNIITTGPLLAEYNRLGITPGALNTALEATARPVRPASLAEFADRVATLPLIADPGDKWSYSIALDLLGRVIEVASGMRFDTFLETRLFRPLDMSSTWFTVPASEKGRLATNYTWLGETRLPIDPGATSVWLTPPSFPYGGAGLVSSARDYDRFLAMLQNGGDLDGVRVLKPETVKLAMSNLLPPGTDTAGLQALSGLGAPLGFGAGGSVYLADAPDGPGKGTFGWAGAAGTLGWVDPVRGVRGTVMVNYFPDTRYPVRTDVSKAVYADLAR
ncbi:serine hydrolase domain-containing protein [Sphingomonas canadensis]|uniref:Serine hydrolase domain-containing protein n=1 Tax=Sphingomonas canadensis TaxID=1219257 RepID=A0ABW3H2E3_9SPHN|nr:serine hydrolase domain-containing protein [Sphingomonas canadensis]MCW3834557.1 beta-lactamase family protein [Sphingomonas canadensis]